ncbi:cache domain-containing sensor histidine kinase [Gracilibacillus kekensis]|uniref:histidine kinase n=1 Tax=Gracilibacillus kekensis TaxID=1027249 RepID=A0A1M7LIR2_9BACI|nr:histidine kinase [Gracilibacillus kekensis]SHM78032.1 two-component system, sensor histidine kinase YesM [Gracilibacillus kekensis]
MIRNSIRNKLIVLLLAITIIPFGTSILITYFYTKESLKDQFIEENVNLLYQGGRNVESYINDLKDLTMSFYNNPDFMNYLKGHGEDDRYLTLDTIKDVMVTILYAESNINRVTITFPKQENELQNVVSVSKQSTLAFSSASNHQDQDFFEKADANPYYMYIEPARHHNVTKQNKKGNSITLHRSLKDAPLNRQLGYMSIDIAPNKFLNLSENLYNKESEEFYILTQEGDSIFSSNQQVTNSSTHPEWFTYLLETEEDSGTLDWDEPSFQGVMVFNKLPESSGGWILVKQIPYTSLFQSALSVAKINILFGIIGLTLVILATLLVSFKITFPIRVLLQNISQIERGNLEVQFQSLGHDEIGLLGHRFKRMMGRINDLINREYKLKLENKTNQLKVLQSQLNPHFLNNALQSIGTLALKNNGPQVYSLVTHLSKIMRYGMHIDEDMVPLMDERDYIQAYLLLQQERFEDKLSFAIDLEEGILDKKIPKMLLQPIVENYFKHGFDSRDKVGEIHIIGTIEAGSLTIEIKDNGIGVSEQRMKEIYQCIYRDDIKDDKVANIGLKNVYSRLKLYYGDRANLQLQNQKSGGLAVTIQLPIDTDGDKNEGDYH